MGRAANVLIVEPHGLCRHALARIIGEARTRLRVVGQAASGPDATAAATEVAPDVVLLGMYDGVGVGVIDDLRVPAPRARIVVLSDRDHGDTLLQALRAGATGFLPHDAGPDDIVDALDGAARGKTVIHPSILVAGLLAADRRSRDAVARAEALSGLTGREREVVELLAEGFRPAAIGKRLFVNPRTIERHLANAYKKLGVHSQSEAVFALERLKDSDRIETVQASASS